MVNHLSLVKYRLTDHARFEMSRRQMSEAEIAQVLAEPEQVEPDRPGRLIYQSRVYAGDPPKTYLLRVFVDVDREPPDVVTVYRTSKIEKYWRYNHEDNL
jgi:hypothetical protein